MKVPTIYNEELLTAENVIKAPLEEKTLQELAEESRWCFERGDAYFKQGAMYYIAGGRRLIEAKRRLKHGQWQNWLAENFPFGQDTAENRMKLAARFGESNSETFRIFKPATLIKLLALPKGDEEEFIKAQADKGHPVESQSARQVQQAVKAWNQSKEVDEITIKELHDEIADVKESKKPHVSFNTGNNEWYTPADIIDAARKVLGRITLDPASSVIANETVKAEKIFTIDDDGLKQNWDGHNIWLNPPYSSGLIEKFVDKLLSSDFCQAIVLVNNATDTEWFSRLANHAAAVVFPKGRVKFYKPDGSTGAPLQGQAILYFGEGSEDFKAAFAKYGRYWE